MGSSVCKRNVTLKHLRGTCVFVGIALLTLSVKSCLSVVALLILSGSCARTLQDGCMYSKCQYSAIVF